MTSWHELCLINRNWKRERFSGWVNLGDFSFWLPFLCEYQHIECFSNIHIHINYLHGLLDLCEM